VGVTFMEHKIDLHTHSFISDGTLSPKDLIKLALISNIKAISLTDHDSIEGITEASVEAKNQNIDFLNGIEISAAYKDGRILHILGLGIDIENKDFLKTYTLMKESRENSVVNILEKIKEKGIFIDINDLKANALNKYLDRYDIHRYFMRNNICSNAQEVWDKYLDPIPYGEHDLFKAEDAINIIHKAHGLSFLAHYNKKIGLGGLTNGEIEENIKYLVDLGLDGLERYYPTFKSEDIKFLDYLINKYSLRISGGTDFHGENRPEAKLGTGCNNMLIPYRVYKIISEKTRI
jgi:predicted metal-dependent phosphoesterase TrpH